jgi:hypothetical protein
MIAGAGYAERSEDGWAEFNLKSALDHEMAVHEL